MRSGYVIRDFFCTYISMVIKRIMKHIMVVFMYYKFQTLILTFIRKTTNENNGK